MSQEVMVAVMITTKLQEPLKIEVIGGGNFYMQEMVTVTHGEIVVLMTP
ncbi:Uncharacterised protein [Candidatus Venteria ishoeyi]|uniref:Uncharacterized protein n=1 Tax=Candidatus Venteria ishoeyi TaxID=1899563 RepID=A0A1H6F494_9GAMM|nr:Uncharacterised protein [Candidatus Venteria ishoeyi]